MTLTSMDSSVYLIFALMDCFALPPVTGAKYVNAAAAIGTTDGDNTPSTSPKQKQHFSASL